MRTHWIAWLALVAILCITSASSKAPQIAKDVRFVYLLNKIDDLPKALEDGDTWGFLNRLFYETWGKECALQSVSIKRESSFWINQYSAVIVISGEAFLQQNSDDIPQRVRAGYLITSNSNALLQFSGEFAVLNWTREYLFPAEGH